MSFVTNCSGACEHCCLCVFDWQSASRTYDTVRIAALAPGICCAPEDHQPPVETPAPVLAALAALGCTAW